MARLMASATVMLVVMLGALAGRVSAEPAAIASIVTVAPVDDEATEESLKTAAASALGRAVRGAQAMGLDEVMLQSIRMVPGTGVVVEILASGSEPPLEDSASAPEAPAPTEDRRI
ncbi:MAG: hypothetical protein ACREJS_16005 [Candidatus Rokuibacteriota bacterium]